MTKRRVSSAERNAPRATIGKEGMRSRRYSVVPTPGSNMYNHASLKSIGDVSSVKVPFAMAVRPISAGPDQLTRIHVNPGPQDYRVVDTNTYLKRSRVIPSICFTTAGKELEGKTVREERAKSPGPSNYRPKSANFLKKSPSATIGNTKRILMAPQGDRLFSPGPSDYQLEKNTNNGPKYHIASRYLKLISSYH